MRFTKIRITGSIMSLLLATTASAQTAASAPALNNLRVINTTSPAQVVYAENMYAYSTSDTVKQQDLKSKEISQEINMPKGGEIYIENSSLAIQVKTWDQPKVKLVTTAYFEKESTLTDTEWFEKMGISLKALGTSVKIKSNNSGFGSTYRYSTSSTGNYSLEPMTVVGYPTRISLNSTNSKAQKRILTIYVPAGSKMDIETKYSDVQLPAGIGDVLLDISNGNLEAENLNKLRLRSKYSNANVRDIKDAEIEFSNGRFSANNIDDLDIESKYATIEMASAKKIKMVSTNDEFEVEDVADILGRKNYGNLRITRLSGSLELDGSNADIKIRNVGSNVKLIKVDNRYADIRIPLRDTKNYAVNFLGNYSTVYADFEKTPAEVTEADMASLSKIVSVSNISATTIPAKPVQLVSGIQGGTISGTLAPAQSSTMTATGKVALGTLATRSGSNTPVKFSATVGDGKGLKIDLKCQNCTVDFK
ncbi:hypothetical protein [Sediminibacterium goheungense]|uniref:Adhesin n=1 Tax=Sediminibacterium goheungense TaxID=1086393 RepID=A0A4R6J2F3_9BACT|nr:hypothetical protein [Sediminibacterium goheungense]TDO29087.1 hypothetical protein BC659_1170 [Sediminibacterium goheungense]